MTQDEIIHMALEACAPNQTFNSDEEWVKRFAALVAAHEREAIAQMFDDAPKLITSAQNSEGGCLICGFTPKIAAAVIRSRSSEH